MALDKANQVMSEINLNDAIDERYGPRDHNPIPKINIHLTHSEYGNSWFNNRENDDAYYMFWSYNNCYYSSSEPVSDEEDEL